MRNATTTALLAAAASLLAAGCRMQPALRHPVIAFAAVPQAAEGGSEQVARIAGRVDGARRGQKIVLFAKSGIWWVQPLVVKPFTDINADGTWNGSTHLGTEYAALLVEPDYRPPATIESLPAAGGSIAAVQVAKGTGTFQPPPRRMLTFSGYEWEVRQSPSERYGANEFDARNVWVDADGLLHLMLANRDGRWTSAEVKLTRSLGYGTYAFVLRDTSRMDPAAAVGLLTWDDLGADQNHRELDIEISRWGNRENKDTQYVVQPQYVAANVFRFHSPASRVTHSFRWEPDRAAFRSVRGAGTTGAPAAPIAEREFTSGVPVSGTETVRMNLLFFRGSPTPPAGNVEVVIEKFEYLP